MSEKYVKQALRFFVVSEDELKEHSQAAFNYWEMLHEGRADNSEGQDFDRYEKAKTACRVNPLDPQHMPEDLFKALIGVKGYSLKGWCKVPEWAEYFAGKENDPAQREYGYQQMERIKR